MEHTNEEARAIWADQDSMPDVLNQEPQGECTVEDFDVLSSDAFASFIFDCQMVETFLESGGRMKQICPPSLNKTFFSATRSDKRIVGYGDTPYEAIRLWAYKTKDHDC